MEQDMTGRLQAFLDGSPSCYHAVAWLRRALLGAGYQELLEFEPWKLERGGRYFVVRGDSALTAFRVPQAKARGFLIAAGHSDCPGFKVREQAEVPSAGGLLRLAVEPYGGAIQRSWLDRALSVAGRVVVRQGNALHTKLVNVDRDLLVIPSVAIHMDRKVNQGTALSPAVDLLPVLGHGEAGAFRRLIAAEAGVSEEDLLSTELFLYPRASATLTGLDEALVLSPRLDDLQCVFGCFQGFLAAQEGESVPIFCVFNNEEVGSTTRQGADSTFLTDVLSRVSRSLGRTEEEHLTAVAESFLVSADNAHAIHPAHPEYADKQEFPVLGGGIVVKYNANQHYTTDAFSAAVFGELCRRCGAPVQRYSNRADLPGGSTLGNIASSHLSIPMVDIGLAQLAMHSCCELASLRDTQTLTTAMKAYFSTSLRRGTDGGIRLQ